MQPLYLAFLSSAATLLAFTMYRTILSIYAWYTSPLRLLPGPPSSSLLMGNMGDLQNKHIDATSQLEEWAAQHGPTVKFAGVMNSNRVFSLDLKAITYVLNHTDQFTKPQNRERFFQRMAAEGLLGVAGDQHKHQRRVMSPAFSPAHIRSLTQIFNEKSQKLCEAISTELTTNGSVQSQTLQIDALSWLSRMTLDVIGMAGFNYEFNALDLDAQTSELSAAFDQVFKITARRRAGPITILTSFLPFLRMIPTVRSKAGDKMGRIIAQIGQRLMADARADGEKPAEKKNRDLLSLLIRANMSPDVPPERRLTDIEVLHQVPTFLIAGHETTSTATSWALFALTKHPDVQTSLRKELMGVHTLSPSMEELNTLPLLDAVVRETLRLYSPVPIIVRKAAHDVVVPLETPFVDAEGIVHTEFMMRKDEEILVPFLAVHRSKVVWGVDADQFKPARWDTKPEKAHHIPGVWGNLLAFSAGPRNCIGYRFSLIETKALLFALIRAFEFELAVPVSDVVPRSTHSIIQRPMVKSQKEKGAQLPVIIRPVRDVV